ncbi:hypothetical protein HID58_032874 [Brassica napus]|uniref:Uncharacterized protein n=2 Tax=Brassica TaxID=3705 RepID=A0ABQ8BXL5_BRANA|nr:hypothetical protein HID58_032872 [Brassica napus]KAH0909553.1 hypothetical protein HID58_032874 [Brassica napus]CAG7861143.1 unnamed protein product [Brassica rapa]CAG7861145.1 unnamed protein product [Brassica rapa]
MSLSKKYILIAFVFTLFLATSIVRCTDIVSDFGVKYNMCYGPCDDKGVCEPYCHTKKGLIRGDCAGKRKGYLGLCCCDEH